VKRDAVNGGVRFGVPLDVFESGGVFGVVADVREQENAEVDSAGRGQHQQRR